MNKQQLVDKIANNTKLTKADVSRVVDSFVHNIKKSVKKNDDVKLVGFGTFTKIKRKARTGVNPQTGKTMKIPASWVPKFRPGVEFKNALGNK